MNEFIEVPHWKYKELLNKEAECEAYRKMAEGYKLQLDNEFGDFADEESYALQAQGNAMVMEAEAKLKYLAVKYGIGESDE